MSMCKQHYDIWVCLTKRYIPNLWHFFGDNDDKPMDLGVPHVQPNPNMANVCPTKQGLGSLFRRNLLDTSYCVN